MTNRTLTLGDKVFVATGECAPTPEEHNAAYQEVQAIRTRAVRIRDRSMEDAKAARERGDKAMKAACVEAGTEAMRIANEAYEKYYLWVRGGESPF